GLRVETRVPGGGFLVAGGVDELLHVHAARVVNRLRGTWFDRPDTACAAGRSGAAAVAEAVEGIGGRQLQLGVAGFDGFAFQQALRRVGERRVAYDVRGARCAVPDRAARQPAQDPGGSVVGIGVDGVHPVTVSAIAVVGDD